MKKINLAPFLISITIALVFFFMGRVLITQMGDLAYWIILIVLVIFYAGWWAKYRKKKS